MKKIILPLLLVAGITSYVNAQQRLVLYEEFTGENCPPCAATNPGLEALIKSEGNADKIIMIKYQVPIPSAGPIYYENTVDPTNRRTYYGVSSAPNARMDGVNSPGGDGSGHPYYLTQAHIDARAAITSNFNITITDVSITSSGVSANISIEAVGAGSYSNLKLRAALVENLDYATPPGTNGETHFMNVTRKMYPSADGQTIDNTWTAGETNTYSISGEVPSYVNLANEHFLVVWIQDDSDKAVHQAARTYPTLDIKSNGITLSGGNGLRCGVPNDYDLSVKIENGGTETITSADIYYKVDGGTWSVYSWTGSLPQNTSTTVTLPTLEDVNDIGLLFFVDSVANPNGEADAFAGNNTSSTYASAISNSGGTFPISSDFEAANPVFTPYFADSAGYPIMRLNRASSGYASSNYMLFYPNYSLSAGVNGYSILPFADLPSGAKALDFYVAYCQYGSENDKLEIVYSTDCGATWTSIWSKQGSALSTKSAQTSPFFPSASAHWRMESVDVSAIPNGAQIAFKATSAYGNNLFIDNVNLRSGAPTSVENLIQNSSVSVYPNPSEDVINIEFNAINAFEATITITDVTGRTIQTIEHSFANGSNVLPINVSQLVSGNYFISIDTNDGSITKQFVKK